MKSSHFLGENFVEDAHMVHQDHEVQMAREELYHSAEYALRLHKLLRNVDEAQGLEGWVSSKITLANDYLKTVLEYMEYELMTGMAATQPSLSIAERVTFNPNGTSTGGFQPSTEPDTPEQAAARQQRLQAYQQQQQAPKPPMPEEEYQRRLQQYKTGGRGSGYGFQPRPEDAAAAEAERAKKFSPTTQQPADKVDEQNINKLKEMTASIATVVNPTPKNKAKTGTLFGGTYKQPKAKVKK